MKAMRATVLWRPGVSPAALWRSQGTCLGRRSSKEESLLTGVRMSGFSCEVITCGDLGQIRQPSVPRFPYLENGDNQGCED